MKRKGFTLIELMIVVAIIAVIAAIAIPGLLRSRIGSNEASAIGSLKAISVGQEQFRSASTVDMNLNGNGEYGLLAELSGVGSVRVGQPAGADATWTGAAITNPYIPRILGQGTDAANWVSTKSGYHFTSYLPSSGTLGAGAAGLNTWGAGVSAFAAAPLQETNYIAYGWPTTVNRSGVRVFVIDQQGQPYQMANSAGTYTAQAAATYPPCFAAYIAAQWDSRIADGAVGIANAQPWTPTS